MYSPEQLWQGLRNPHLVKREIRIKTHQYLPHDVGIQGSYFTGNIGDEALGQIFKSEMSTNGRTVRVFPDTVSMSNSEWQLLGGGGVLHDWYGAKALRRRLEYVSDGGMIVGVGAPGIKSKEARQLTKEHLPETSLITVRDEQSKRRIQEISNVEVIVTADPAFLYNAPTSNTGIRHETGVNFRPWFKSASNGFPWTEFDEDTLSWYFDFEEDINMQNAFDSYVKKAQRICEIVEDPVFIPFHEMDEKFAREHLDVEILKHTNSVHQTLERINSVKKMVTSRYHSLVFAAICEKPIHALTYAPKVRNLSSRLNVAHSEPHIETKLDFRIPQGVDTAKSAARKNFELIEEKITNT